LKNGRKIITVMNDFFTYDAPPVETGLPEPVVERHGKVWVVRDDLLPGGTKRRFLYRFLKAQSHVKEWVYASPRVGYAQVALAHVAKDLGLKGTVVIPKGKHYHLTTEAISLGANVIEVPMGFLSHIQHVAKTYTEETEGSQLLPFGLDHPIIIDEISRIASNLPIKPKEVWTCISSGVLSRGLQKAWPDAKVYGVLTGHGTNERERGRAEIMKSKYKFNQKCKPSEKPPFPSSDYYDSKVWKFIEEMASEDALFWNVGA
jgi:hypothetical protein